MASSSGAPKVRLLCLHGHRTSGGIMKQQLEAAKWMETIGDLVQLTFVDAVWPATGPSDVKDHFEPPYFEWYQANKDFSEVHGVDEAIAYIAKTIKDKGPFDGFLAFSQGAILGCALIGLQEKGLKFFDTPKIGMVVVVGGACSKDVRLKPAYYDPISCPSLHFIGDTDKARKKAEVLASHFEGAIVIRHPRGRVVPVIDQAAAQTFRAFLSDQLARRYKK